MCVMNVLVAHIKQLPSDIPPGPDGAVNILDAISGNGHALRKRIAQAAALLTVILCMLNRGEGLHCLPVLRRRSQGRP